MYNFFEPPCIINDTISLFFKLQSTFLVISNRNSFRVLFFGKIASVYFINMARRGKIIRYVLM